MIEMKSIQKFYGKKDLRRQILKDLDMTVKEGEMVAVMGSSGVGKSTLLNLIAGLSFFDEGEYFFNGEKISCNERKRLEYLRRYELSMVVQYFALIDELNVYENIALPLRYQKKSKKEIRERVWNVLEEMKLVDKRRGYPEELSGGEKQRVAIARAIVSDPKVILADEPTGALDRVNTQNVIEIFEKLHKSGCTIIIATHDLDVATHCDKIYQLQDGKLFLRTEKEVAYDSDFISEKSQQNL